MLQLGHSRSGARQHVHLRKGGSTSPAQEEKESHRLICVYRVASLPTSTTCLGAEAPSRKHHSLWPDAFGSILTWPSGRTNPRAEVVLQATGRKSAGYVVSWRMHWHQRPKQTRCPGRLSTPKHSPMATCPSSTRTRVSFPVSLSLNHQS